MSVDVTISSKVRKPVNQALLMAAARAVFADRKAHGEVDIQVVGDRLMKSRNHESLNHDYTTDVLSWYLGGSGKANDPLFAAVMVCRDYAEREAIARGISLDEELARYVIHGCLHAFGFDDHDEADHARMWKLQEKIVGRVMGG